MFHENLKNLRLKKGLSQKQLADHLNISPQSISKWEKGIALPSIEFLPPLADCLCCEINDFFANNSKSISFEYRSINTFLRLEYDEIYGEEEKTKQLATFTKENPYIFEATMAFCNKIKEYKILKQKNIQALLNCSAENAKAFMQLLVSLELLEKLDIEDSYFVIKSSVDGLIILMRTQKKLYEYI